MGKLFDRVVSRIRPRGLRQQCREITGKFVRYTFVNLPCEIELRLYRSSLYPSPLSRFTDASRALHTHAQVHTRIRYPRPIPRGSA